MRLLKLNLMNFQNIRSLELDFNGGKSGDILGDNGTGKTTIANSISWLLFDKSSTGAKGFNPKTKDVEGDMHHLEHGVEGVFEVDSGRIVTLKKIMKEVYKKKRGSASEEFDGHTVDYYIDGVPSKLSEFNAAVSDFCGGNTERSRVLTNPTYFSEEMSVDERRKILLEMCGDISDEDILAANPDLADLNSFLLKPGTKDQKYSIDEYKKVAMARKKDINKRLTEIPARIDEAEHAIPNLSGITLESVNEEIERLDGLKKGYMMEAVSLQSSASRNEDLLKMNELQKAMTKASSEYGERQRAEQSRISSETRGAEKKLFDLKNEKEKVSESIDRMKDLISRLETVRAKLMAQYTEIKSRTWDEGESLCPVCHRELPPDQIEEKKAAFNIQKSNDLSEINERGKKEANKEMISAKKAEVENALKRLEELGKAIGEQEQVLARIAKSYTFIPFEKTDEYAALQAQIEAVNQKMKNTSDPNAEAKAEITAKIEDVTAKINQQSELKTQLEIARVQNERIITLEREEKMLAGEYEEIEKGLFLCESFTRAKVNALTDKINSRFTSVRFRLFVEQLNGGIREDCEVMIPTEEGRMVPYTFANHAARINAGLELIEAISKHWGFSMPVIVDNAESITHLRHIDAQVLRLIVNEPDKALRLELAS